MGIFFWPPLPIIAKVPTYLLNCHLCSMFSFFAALRLFLCMILSMTELYCLRCYMPHALYLVFVCIRAYKLLKIPLYHITPIKHDNGSVAPIKSNNGPIAPITHEMVAHIYHHPSPTTASIHYRIPMYYLLSSIMVQSFGVSQNFGVLDQLRLLLNHNLDTSWKINDFLWYVSAKFWSGVAEWF